MRTRSSLLLACLWLLFVNGDCTDKTTAGDSTKPATPAINEMDCWLTKGDRTALLHKQTSTLTFGTVANSHATIDVDSTKSFQSVDGFGYTLTSGSAQLIDAMGAEPKATLLQELFGNAPNAISVSYLRIAIGASDLSESVYSYDDMPAGQTDANLDHFSLARDKNTVIALLKEILQINPAIKIIATPWSPPVWMKDNGDSKGGSLKAAYYSVYAMYFVKYIQAMKAEGITIDAVTPQNEPLHPGNNPSMYMSAAQQADFIKNHLGPAFQSAGISTKIVVYDHNCNKPEYPLEILNDAAAKKYVDGSAFHLYEGDISALSKVHDAHPDKNVYFTEQWTGANGSFDGDLKWHIKNVIIGSMRNWSKVALEWNLANDPNYNPHTPGGCTECKGALTINGATATPNVGYYIIAHASKFVPAGSVRIESTNAGSIYTVAFKRPDGKKVLIALNDGNSEQPFNIKYKGKWVSTSLAAGAVGTFVW